MDARTLSPQLPQWLLPWYEQNKRDLSWRQDRNPYHIWVSEIMLQQTRVAAVLGYYQRFLAAFPTVEDLAAAPEEQLMKLWEGLGYYSRARNLHLCAKMVAGELNGRFPYRVRCRYTDEAGTVHEFLSDNLRFDPTGLFLSDTVEVYVDPYTMDRYYVDVAGVLPNVAQH